MKIYEFVFMFGVFLISFYACATFVTSFNYNQPDAPSEVISAWDASVTQINQSLASIQSSYEKVQSGGIEAVVGTISLALSGIYFLIISLYSTFVSIPSAVFGSIQYLASQFGVPASIITIVVGIISVMVIINVIKFITGREL